MSIKEKLLVIFMIFMSIAIAMEGKTLLGVFLLLTNISAAVLFLLESVKAAEFTIEIDDNKE